MENIGTFYNINPHKLKQLLHKMLTRVTLFSRGIFILFSNNSLVCTHTVCKYGAWLTVGAGGAGGMRCRRHEESGS